MSRSRPHRHRGRTLTPHPSSHPWALLLAVLCCVALLGACAPGSQTTQTGAEETSEGEPTEEQSDAIESDETSEVTPVAVELPGLPVGGDGITLTSNDLSGCVRVNWTAGTLLDGVTVTIRGFANPAPFVLAPEACGSSAAPCIGSALTAARPWCEQGVLLPVPLVDFVTVPLSVAAADLACVDRSRCDSTQQLIAAEGEATLDLSFEPDVVDPETSPTEGETSPSEGESSPAFDDGATVSEESG